MKMKNSQNMKRLGRVAIMAGAIGLVLAGCKAPSLLPTERMQLPDTYAGKDTDTTTIARLPWTVFFPDTTLQGYIQEALLNNHSFQQVLEQVSLARSQVRLGKGALLPEVTLGVEGGVQRFGEYTMDGVGNSTTNTPDLAKDKHIPDPYRHFQLGLSFQWEADVWGKLNDRKRAAALRWMKSIEAMRLAHTLLISEVATQYFELVGLDKQRTVLRSALQTARNAYHLTNELMKEGEVTRLSVDQFRSRRLQLEELLLSTEQQIQDKERAIAVLLGRFPFAVRRVSFEQLCSYEYPTEAGVPAQLLQYRPDVKAAEYELLASKADASAARKAFFPSLVIGGNGGYNAFDLDKWFTSPASLTYSLAAGITAPIFQQNRLRALWSDSKSQQRIALLDYHKTVLTAYSEVSGLLTASAKMQDRRAFKQEESRIHHRSIYNATELFKVGFVGYLDVLSADERFVNCELERIALNIESCKLNVMLYRALGGGLP